MIESDISKIIILTPVKNEAWILHQFLSITSLFADCIIIADQQSTDESRVICAKFSKVHLIENESTEYDESERQLLLIKTARSLFPHSKRILLALDADELFSADSLNFTSDWQQIKSSAPGTTIYFEKPDILPGIKKCIRYKDNYFPAGYADDNIIHIPSIIHSKRIPVNINGQNLHIDDIKIMHFAHSRRNVQSSKLRYYSVVENINNTNPVYLRRSIYACNYDENKFYPGRNIEEIPKDWIKDWNQKGLDLKGFRDPKVSWFDFEVLRLFKQFGSQRFHYDNIWCFDWEACRQAGIKTNKEVPSEKIKYPGYIKQTIAKTIDKLYAAYKYFKVK